MIHRLSPLTLLFASFLMVVMTVAHAEEKVLPLPQPLVTNCLLLNFEKDPAKLPKDDKLLYTTGEVVKQDAENMNTAGGLVQLRKKGYVMHDTVLRWTLPQGFKPGKYDIYTLVGLGGIAPQSYLIRIGADATSIASRAEFRQANIASWQMNWQDGKAVVELKSGDTVIEIEIKGNATDQKMIKAFLLVLQGS